MSYGCTKLDEKFSQQVDFQKIQMALVHDDCYQRLQNINFSNKTAFFRIIHEGKPPNDVCPEGFHYQVVNPGEDMPGVALFINRCYEKSA